jgi:hypothetical protein
LGLAGLAFNELVDCKLDYFHCITKVLLDRNFYGKNGLLFLLEKMI